MDDGGVAALALRLHITERHLHRLFTAELGVGPLAVARTKRLLLAKQLLTETALPVTDVAFAAGFGSVRQFNATMKERYGFSPTELRATAAIRRPAATPDAGPAGTPDAGPAALTLRLHYRPPLEAEALLSFLAEHAIPGLERVDGAGYTRFVRGGSIALAPRRDHIALVARVADTRHLARIVARARRLLDLDAEPGAIADALGGTALAP
ncbi:helix-turn-helix domain-containing protein [Thermocatellispora tengchongensis]|uniref:helix-turn-helix domain-containing protein n=1 Tax=Thermocatellispora tengchongensis TaxID=1073253 RepID=UPI003645581E